MFGSLKEKLKNWTSKVKKEIFWKQEPGEKPKKSKIPIEESSKNKPIKNSSKKTSKLKEKFSDINKTSHEITEKTEQQNNKSETQKEIEQGTEQPIQEKKLKEKRSFFSRLFGSELSQDKFEELFQELEITLLQNNVAYEVVEKIKQELSSRIIGKKDYSIEKELKEIIQEILIEPPNFFEEIGYSLKNKKPFVIVLVGINGAGKTTAIAKLTHLLQKNKFSVCLAAADTYRAASIEQLEVHANRLNVPMIKKDYGTDPASVGFEAIRYAKKNNIDIVIIDTAGRLNNKENLMKELEKIIRITNPDMKVFTGESTTGNDATEQARTFNKLINITGTILSKADIDEKGGTMISVGYITKKPILFLGTGQNYEDLEVFNKKKIIDSLGL